MANKDLVEGFGDNPDAVQLNHLFKVCQFFYEDSTH